jgi:hypothetical protein
LFIFAKIALLFLNTLLKATLKLLRSPMKKLFCLVMLTGTVAMHGMSTEQHRAAKLKHLQTMEALAVLAYCNEIGSQMVDRTQTWPYPKTFYTPKITGDRHYGIPTQTFETMCKDAADKLIALRENTKEQRETK